MLLLVYRTKLEKTKNQG